MSASEVQHVEGGGVGYCSSSAAAAAIIDSYHLTANIATSTRRHNLVRILLEIGTNTLIHLLDRATAA